MERPHFRGYHEKAGGGRHLQAGTTGIAELPGSETTNTEASLSTMLLQGTRARYGVTLTCNTPFYPLNPRSPRDIPLAGRDRLRVLGRGRPFLLKGYPDGYPPIQDLSPHRHSHKAVKVASS